MLELEVKMDIGMEKYSGRTESKGYPRYLRYRSRRSADRYAHAGTPDNVTGGFISLHLSGPLHQPDRRK
jgi:hypothetical protein